VRHAEVRYAEHDGKGIAYEVFGRGPSDILLFQSSCPIDLLWDLPQLASFMETLGRFARVIVFDVLGHGASDPIGDRRGAAATLEGQCDDALAVLEAAQADRVSFVDMSLGVLGVAFAATYPQRVRSLIVTHLRPSFPEVRSACSAKAHGSGQARDRELGGR